MEISFFSTDLVVIDWTCLTFTSDVLVGDVFDFVTYDVIVCSLVDGGVIA